MADKKRFKLIASVYLIPIKDGKTLLGRRMNTGYEDGKYGLVAGHIEGKETLREALLREVKEEAGIKLDQEKLKFVLTMHRWCGDHERVDFFFTAESWEGKVENNEPNKCDDLRWFPLDQLPDNTIPYIRSVIDCYQKGIVYSEFGWEER